MHFIFTLKPLKQASLLSFRFRCLFPVCCSIKLWWAQTSLRCLIFTTAAVLFCVALSMAITETVHSWRNKDNDLAHWNPKYRRKPAAIDEPTDVKDPSLHYGIVIDCGSSGSRVYIYFWPTHSGNPKDLLDIQPMRDESGKLINKKIQPGNTCFYATVHLFFFLLCFGYFEFNLPVGAYLSIFRGCHGSVL